MLVLSRKPDEWVRIADNIEIGVIAVKGNQVRLGFRVPSEIPVLRGEICDPPILPMQPQKKNGKRGRGRFAA